MKRGAKRTLDSIIGDRENINMKTILDLPDALASEIELRADREGREVGDVVADLLVAAISATSKTLPRNGGTVPKTLPLIKVRSVLPPAARSLAAQDWCDWIKEYFW